MSWPTRCLSLPPPAKAVVHHQPTLGMELVCATEAVHLNAAHTALSSGRNSAYATTVLGLLKTSRGSPTRHTCRFCDASVLRLFTFCPPTEGGITIEQLPWSTSLVLLYLFGWTGRWRHHSSSTHIQKRLGRRRYLLHPRGLVMCVTSRQ